MDQTFILSNLAALLLAGIGAITILFLGNFFRRDLQNQQIAAFLTFMAGGALVTWTLGFLTGLVVTAGVFIAFHILGVNQRWARSWRKKVSWAGFGTTGIGVAFAQLLQEYLK